MKRRTLTLFTLLLVTVLTVTARSVRRWDFTQWSAATVENLKADAAGWSDIEKANATEPTELSAGNCFWEVTAQGMTEGVTLTANSQPIAELEGLLYTNTRNRSLAIAVNYGDLTSTGTDFAPYHGPSYLWLGGKEQNYLVIPSVPAGAKIRIGVESHKVTDSRGVQLFLGNGNTGTQLKDAEGNDVPTVTAYTEQEWVVPTDAADEKNTDGTYNVQIRNTNGCHIYYIEVDDASSWIFANGVSRETIANLQADETWEVTLNDDGTFNRAAETAKHTGPFYANGVEIAEVEGLALGTSGLSTSNNVILFSNKFRINRDKMRLILPQLVAGQTITVRAHSANSDATDRGLRIETDMAAVVKQPKDGLVPGKNVASDDREQDGNFTFVWRVTSNITEPTDIPLIAITGGVDIASIVIDRSVGTTPAPNPLFSYFKAEVNGRQMYFHITDREAHTVETYPCEEFRYGKAIELFEGETEHYINDGSNFCLSIPAKVVNPDDGETYSVVGIADESFMNMWYFKAIVTVPEGVAYVGKRAFFNNRWAKIVLPSTLNSIAGDAFGKSWNLEVMKVAMRTPVSKAVVGGDQKGDKASAKLLVPYGTKEAYAAAEYWSLFGTIEEFRPTGTVFTAQTEQDIDMQFRVLSEDDMTVETYAEPYTEGKPFSPAIDKNFSGELIVPAEIEGYRVVGIGGWSFRECSKITSASLPVGITYIGGSAFRMATSLQSVNIPEGVESIGEYAFNGNAMTNITLPSTLKRITGDKVFKNDNAKREDGEFTVIANMTEPCYMDEGSIRYKSYYHLYVPKGSKEAYLADPLWSQFGKIREIGEVDEEVKDIVSANDVTLKAGENAKLTVSLTTKDTDYNAYQFFLYLPEGVSIATTASGHKIVSELTDRKKAIREAGDGSIMMVAYATDSNADALASGPLMEIMLTVDEAVAAGEYTARLERVACSTRESKSVSLPSATFTITVEKAVEPEVPAIFEAEDVEGDPAGSITLPIFLNNQTDITGFYFDLTLPKGVTVADGGAKLVGNYADSKIMLTCQPWSIDMGDNVNTWRFIALPMDGSKFLANAGHVMNITLSVDPNMQAGVYSARLMNVHKLNEVFDESEGSRAMRVMRAQADAPTTSYAKITIKSKTVLQGDVNSDFVVDVADIATVISVMAGTSSVSSATADVNLDGTVDVADIATIISKMAGNSRRQRSWKE